MAKVFLILFKILKALFLLFLELLLVFSLLISKARLSISFLVCAHFFFFFFHFLEDLIR